ncbi:hypothetical protein RUM43_006741 [Polyplax serrata]|uniref:Uncharacterized protein n=1 Tax=Polyplax serrata TaxID=468196 RepID=A0AAN8P4S4_POLSC
MVGNGLRSIHGINITWRSTYSDWKKKKGVNPEIIRLKKSRYIKISLSQPSHSNKTTNTEPAKFLAEEDEPHSESQMLRRVGERQRPPGGGNLRGLYLDVFEMSHSAVGNGRALGGTPVHLPAWVMSRRLVTKKKKKI